MKKAMHLFEPVFEAGYLIFDLIAGILFLTKGHTTLMTLYGLLTLTLCFGDAFHLVPRIICSFKEKDETLSKWLGRGLQISSITMTVFYVLLMYIWQLMFHTSVPSVILILIWLSALVRIVVCLFPQNNWCTTGNMKLSMIRNGVFLITGIAVIYLFYSTNMMQMCYAIGLSFACYIPVTLWAKKKPMVGMLMIPKTCAYIWMIVIGLNLL